MSIRQSAGSFLIVILIVIMLPAVAAGQGERTFTLADVQRLALGNYETIPAAREQVEQAALMRRQAGAAVLPNVSVTSAATRNFVPASFSFGGRQIDVLPGFDYNVALTVSQPLYAGLRDLKVRHQADLQIDIAESIVGTTAQDAVLEATRAYYGVLSAQDNVEISKRALDVAAETLRTAESRYRAGEAVETAVLRARVAQSDARRELLQAENALELMRNQVAVLIGVTGPFTVTRPSRPAAPGRPLADLIAAGLETRAELKAMALQRQIAELEIEKRHGQYFPVVRAEATYLQRRSGFPSNKLGAVSLTATWTLFDGGRVAAEVADGQSRLRELHARAELLRKQTTEQIRAAYLNVETLAASVDMLDAQVAFARRNAEATSAAFRVGEATDLDVLEANATLTRSERQLAMTTYSLEVAVYELQRAVGTMGQDLIADARVGGAE